MCGVSVAWCVSSVQNWAVFECWCHPEPWWLSVSRKLLARGWCCPASRLPCVWGCIWTRGLSHDLSLAKSGNPSALIQGSRIHQVWLQTPRLVFPKMCFSYMYLFSVVMCVEQPVSWSSQPRSPCTGVRANFHAHYPLISAWGEAILVN